jgi:2-haloacid dehalogenase
LAKPDPGLYDVLVSRFGVDPRSAVYVDDKAANVDTAAALGFTGLVFTTADVLRADLVGLGLLCGRP